MQSYSYYYFWNPYFATGTPILTPLRSIVQGITSSFFISFLSIFIGYNSSVKLYIFATVFFMGISFYALTGEFGAHFISRSVSSSFFLLNPIMFTMIAYGDFPLFVAFGFYFIGLKFLIRFSRKGGDSYLLPLAILFLLFSVVYEQLFYLGSIVYIIFGTFYVDKGRKEGFKQKIVLKGTYALKLFFYITSVSMVFLIPFFFASYLNVGPSSPLSRTLQFYQDRSQSVLTLLFLKGAGNLAFSSVSALGSLIADFWSYLVVALFVILITYTLLTRKSILILLTIIIIIGALIGSGSDSPIAILPEWLYLHIPGYQLFPESYLWDEILIAPIMSLFLTVILDYSLDGKPRRSPNSSKKHFGKLIGIFSNKMTTILLSALIVFVGFAPLITQGYYSNPQGLNNTSNVITSYNSLYSSLERNLSNTDYAVAFFPGDPYVYYDNNTSNYFDNPLLERPSYRVLDYASGTPSQNSFFYWLYQEFYNNDTIYMPELMATVGVKYFVVLKNFNSFGFGSLGVGKNVLQLMKYQRDLKVVSTSNNYTIYESTLNISQAYEIKSVSLVVGPYNLLNYLAYSGYDLVDNTILFSSDINIHNFNSVMPMVSSIFTQNLSSVLGFTNEIFGANTSLSVSWYSKIRDSIESGTVNFIEIFTPEKIKLTLQDTKSGDSYTHRTTADYPQGNLLHLQAQGGNISNISLNTGFGNGIFYLSFLGDAGGIFYLNGNKDNLFGFNPKNYTSNSVGWMEIPKSYVGSNRFLNLSMVNGYILSPGFIYSNFELSFGSAKKLNNISFHKYPYNYPANLTFLSSHNTTTVSGNFTFNISQSGTVFSILSNFTMGESNGLSISFNISGPVGAYINGLYVTGSTKFRDQIAITSPLLALRGKSKISELTINFDRLNTELNVTNRVSFSISFFGVLDQVAPIISIRGSIPLNSSVSYSQTGYSVNHVSGQYVAYYIPYYEQSNTINGKTYSALGGIDTFARISGTTVHVTFDSFTYTINGGLISLSLVFIGLIFQKIIIVVRTKKRSN